MTTELARPDWLLPPLTSADCGPYGGFPRLTDAEKRQVWAGHHAQRPGRVPVTLSHNNRVVLLDPRIDPAGLTYERVFREPEAMLLAQLRWHYLARVRYNVLCDAPTELPEAWEIGLDFQNVYAAACLGAPLHFHAEGIPDTQPVLADDGRKRTIFDVDIDRPLQTTFCTNALALHEKVVTLAAGKTFAGRPIRVLPYSCCGTDGPLTVAMNLRGPAVLADLKRDPDYVRQLFDFILQAALNRHHAFVRHWNLPPGPELWLADDSIAMLSTAQYREHVLPHHRRWYDTLDPRRTAVRGIHLCGDATRHFRTIRDELGVTIFDTGFPVDFATLRRELGRDVTLLGGVEVPLLVGGTPPQVYSRTLEILHSGVWLPGRFVLREANNLPPGVSWANLAAMYQAAFDYRA